MFPPDCAGIFSEQSNFDFNWQLKSFNLPDGWMKRQISMEENHQRGSLKNCIEQAFFI
jgi:hypothetical protein